MFFWDTGLTVMGPRHEFFMEKEICINTYINMLVEIHTNIYKTSEIYNYNDINKLYMCICVYVKYT